MQFAYRGRRPDGRAVAGFVEAAAAQGAARQLREQGLFVTRLEPARGWRLAAGLPSRGAGQVGRPLAPGEWIILFRQLGSTLHAGLPLLQALAVLDAEGRGRAAQVLRQLSRGLQGGASLSRALEDLAPRLPPYVVPSLRVAEQSGNLDASLLAIADELESEQALQRKMRGALAYPKVVGLFALGAVLIIVTYVIPTIVAALFPGTPQLPWPTLALLGAARFTQEEWLPCLLAAAGLYGLRRIGRRHPAVRRAWDGLALRLPLSGPALQQLLLARLGAHLATLASAGMPLSEALQLAGQALGNAAMEEAVSVAARDVRAGHSFAHSLRRQRLFPPLLVSLVEAAEVSGNLAGVLDRTARHYRAEAERRLEALTRLIEPAFTLILAGLVAFLLLAVYLPIFQGYRGIL